MGNIRPCPSGSGYDFTCDGCHEDFHMDEEIIQHTELGYDETPASLCDDCYHWLLNLMAEERGNA